MENICEGCKYDKIVSTQEEFDVILDNCTSCKRGVLPEYRDNYTDNYTKEIN